MSQTLNPSYISRPITTAMGAALIVALTAADNVLDLAVDAEDPLFGVTRRDVAAGAVGDVAIGGIVPLVYGDDVAPGEPVTADSAGRGVPAGAGERYIGFAVEGGAVGVTGALLIAHGFVPQDAG